jgi:LysR family nitrogen assimilation transcriptional regulator
MDLRQLKYFLAVADAGGFSKAAERVCVAQPALSAHVARLEEELGAPLFSRSSKGATLTQAGTVLVDHATDIFKRIRNTEDAVRHASDEVRGTVSLGLPATMSIVLAVPLLREIRTKWPGISLRLLEGHSGWLQEWLAAGRLDKAVLFGSIPAKA